MIKEQKPFSSTISRNFQLTTLSVYFNKQTRTKMPLSFDYRLFKAKVITQNI